MTLCQLLLVYEVFFFDCLAAQFCGNNKDEQEKTRIITDESFDVRRPSYSHSCLAAHPYRRGGRWGPAVGKCREMRVHNEKEKQH